MPKNDVVKTSSDAALKTVADALDMAVTAAKHGAANAKATAGKLLPATGQFLSRFIYTTSYAFSYGLMFPVVSIVKSMPAVNVVTHGFIDGAQAANEKVVQMKIRHLESPAAPVRARAKTTKMKRGTTR
jgi:hypothetical protein